MGEGTRLKDIICAFLVFYKSLNDDICSFNDAWYDWSLSNTKIKMNHSPNTKIKKKIHWMRNVGNAKNIKIQIQKKENGHFVFCSSKNF